MGRHLRSTESRPGAGGWRRVTSGNGHSGTCAVSAAAVGDDEVGEDACREAGGEEDEAEFAVAVAAHAVPDFADHVQDGAAGDGVEHELERFGGDVVADDR